MSIFFKIKVLFKTYFLHYFVNKWLDRPCYMCKKEAYIGVYYCWSEVNYNGKLGHKKLFMLCNGCFLRSNQNFFIKACYEKGYNENDLKNGFIIESYV